MESFDSIDCITIERFYQEFIASNRAEIYRYVALGLHRVDLDKMEMRTVSSDGLAGEAIKLVRSNTH